MRRGVAILFIAIGMGRVARADDAAATASTNRSRAQLSIEDALVMAGSVSEDVEAARAGVERANAEVGIARSELFPQVNAAGSYQRTIASEFDNLDFGGPDASSSGFDLPFGRPNTWRAGLSL